MWRPVCWLAAVAVLFAATPPEMYPLTVVVGGLCAAEGLAWLLERFR